MAKPDNTRAKFPWQLVVNHPLFLCGNLAQAHAVMRCALIYWQCNCDCDPSDFDVERNCGLGPVTLRNNREVIDKYITSLLNDIRLHYISETERLKMIVDRTRKATEARKRNKQKVKNNKENSRFSDLTSEKQEISIHAPATGARMTHHIAKTPGAFSD